MTAMGALDRTALALGAIFMLLLLLLCSVVTNTDARQSLRGLTGLSAFIGTQETKFASTIVTNFSGCSTRGIAVGAQKDSAHNLTVSQEGDASIVKRRQQTMVDQVLASYFNITFEAMNEAYRAVLRPQGSSWWPHFRVTITQGRIFLSVVPQDLTSQVQQTRGDVAAWLKYAVTSCVLLSVTMEKHAVHDVDFLIVASDRPFELNAFERDTKHLAFPKSLVYLPPMFSYNAIEEALVIPFPTWDFTFFESSFFDDVSHYRYDQLPAVPVAERRPTLLFTGQMHGHDGMRARAFRLSLLRPDLIDATTSSPPQECTERYGGMLARYHLSPVQDIMSDCQRMVGPYKAAQDHVRYRYMLDIDGHGGTFRLKNILASGSVLFKVESDTYQFFYADLQPWVHFVPVRKDNFEEDLIAKIEWARANDDVVRRMIEKGREFADTFLTLSWIISYQAYALNKYASKMTYQPQPPPDSVLFCCGPPLTNALEQRGWRLPFAQRCKLDCNSSQHKTLWEWLS